MRLAVLALLAAALTACGNVCDRGESTGRSFTEKAKPCFPGGSGPTLSFDKTKCDASVDKCTAKDVSNINKYFDCLDKLPTCKLDNTAEFNAAFLTCTSPMLQLSDGCFAQ